MGNLSNPSINRWGLTLFWYNFWYTDKNSQQIFHQEQIFSQIIYNFIFYGLNMNKIFFFNLYWFKKIDSIYKNTLENINNFNSLTSSYVEYKNKLDQSTDLVFYRKKKKYIYLSKIWILRYQSWCILNLYSIQEIIPTHKIIQQRLISLQTHDFNYNDSTDKFLVHKLLIRSFLFFKKIQFSEKKFKYYYSF